MKFLACAYLTETRRVFAANHWRALVKMQGVSHKPELEGAAGGRRGLSVA